ncbi:MAG: hypothetical protein AAF465_07125 [Pseudomonadota bacterium]
MDVLAFLVGVFALLLVGTLVVIGSVYVIGILIAAWPTIIGIVGGIVIWRSGSDNWGVLFAIAGFVGQYLWATRMIDKQ